jgi:hypothetical protein
MALSSVKKALAGMGVAGLVSGWRWRGERHWGKTVANSNNQSSIKDFIAQRWGSSGAAGLTEIRFLPDGYQPAGPGQEGALLLFPPWRLSRQLPLPTPCHVQVH